MRTRLINYSWLTLILIAINNYSTTPFYSRYRKTSNKGATIILAVNLEQSNRVPNEAIKAIVVVTLNRG